MTLTIPFQNSYARLPDRFFARQQPAPAPEPHLIAWNSALARALGITGDTDPEEIARYTSGTLVPKGAEPIAQAYAGHQFGGFVPQLGDGRAVLLGEIATPQGRFDIQLKGAGRTPFSRGGDGLAWIGPVLREYLVSEAMHAMGVPTTRALAATLTGTPVIREATARPGAVLTRVAASHIRVGTFQYFAARQDREAVQALYEHTIARHYPQADSPEALLTAVMQAQARLIAAWMSVGFIHGVMNTDNTALSGESIDYGPCAFMDAYDPQTVFSSIDRHGRYSYDNQPAIIVWNIAQFASCLLPLMPDEQAAIARFTEMVNAMPEMIHAEWRRAMGRKLGIAAPTSDDEPLITGFLSLLNAQEADFTNSFRALADTPESALPNASAAQDWMTAWQKRLAREDDPQALMRAVNPAIIPRNHIVEQMIRSAMEGDFAPFRDLVKRVATPYADHDDRPDLKAPPKDNERVLATFCGT